MKFHTSMIAVLAASVTLVGTTAMNTAATTISADAADSHTTQALTSVHWSITHEGTDSASRPYYIQRLVVRGNLNFPRLCFNQFARSMRLTDPRDTLIELVPGYYAIASPRLAVHNPDSPATNVYADPKDEDSVVFEIQTRGRFVNISYAPDGFHRVNADGTTDPVERILTPLQRDMTEYAAEVYRHNEAMVTDWTAGFYDVIPSYKKVTPGQPGAMSRVDIPGFVDIDPENPDYYRIEVHGDSATIFCRPDRQWANYIAFNSKVLSRRDSLGRIPDVVIEDWPDMPWRGLMIDIARNFQRPQTMKVVLALMASNHLNRLHFHITDDEAWRLEIPGLPELTDVGAHRGYTLDERSCLKQIFTGDGNPRTYTGTSNGYYTREEFIDLIRTAHNMGIEVVPEIESPGHARAAIRAMEARRLNSGDERFRLIEDGDTSRYTSAQAFHDNIMNPAVEGTYRFMEKIIDEIASMYSEAGVPLIGIHIGGDEVPRGAWDGSAAVTRLKAREHLQTQTRVHAYYVQRIAAMLAARHIPMHGWQEVALDHDEDYNKSIAPVAGGVNCWSTLSRQGSNGVTDRVVLAGFPAILSNVNHLYFDLAYSRDPQEPGLAWGGYVDEFSAFNAYAHRLCPAMDKGPGKVIGLNAHVFGETMRSAAQLKTYLLPKILGLAERAWNCDSTYSESQFNAIVGTRDLPYYASQSLNVHLRQPGIRIDGNTAFINSPYPTSSEVIVRYTLDGTDPNESSPIYTTPVSLPDNCHEVRATAFAFGTRSAAVNARR